MRPRSRLGRDAERFEAGLLTPMLAPGGNNVCAPSLSRSMQTCPDSGHGRLAHGPLLWKAIITEERNCVSDFLTSGVPHRQASPAPEKGSSLRTYHAACFMIPRQLCAPSLTSLTTLGRGITKVVTARPQWPSVASRHAPAKYRQAIPTQPHAQQNFLRSLLSYSA